VPVTEQAFRKLALEDPNGLWEFHCGQARQKPGMSAAHNQTMSLLFGFLFQQLDRTQYAVRANAGHVRRSADRYYIPDVYVVPMELVLPQLGERDLETFDAPLPLVVEIWSPSTGSYDVNAKLIEYQARGDLEIWLVHPYERSVRSWARQPDGTYQETVDRGGIVRPIALPGVAVDLDALF
jgi:Uma2 family endonuclease